MSLDKSLKSANTLRRHRNVLKRAERIVHLQELGGWDEGRSPFGLPKIVHRKVVSKKSKSKKVEAAEGDGDSDSKDESESKS